MNYRQKYLSAYLLGIATLVGGASPAWALVSRGAASNFAVLSAAPDHGGAVTCTNSVITGDVGSSGQPASVVQTSCVINGAIIAPVSAQTLADFESAYAALAAVPCGQQLTGTLAGVTLTPGVYCFDAAAALTGTLTLSGGSNDTWLFKVGSGAVGALTGTNFSVVMEGGGLACNVTWWVNAAATMTTSNFLGTIYAGAAITTTGGTFDGNALARAAVTLTGATLTGCQSGTSNPPPPKQRCNQGVGNGPEGCDPGNSNQSNRYPNLNNPFLRSNDEPSLTTPGGVPGNPGRKGGNK